GGRSISRSSAFSDSPRAAEAMVAVALADIHGRHYLDAEPLLIAAETILEERVAPDHPALAAALAALARIALARGEPAEAERLAERAVGIARRNPHGRSTEPLRALGAALAARERFAEAEQVLNEALAQDREHHGPEGLATPRVAYVELELARLDRQGGKEAEAETAFKDARRILRKAEDEEHRRERRV